MGCSSSQPALTEFAVGLGGHVYHPASDGEDYRELTALEWGDPAWRARLLAEHAAHGGWRFLEDPAVVMIGKFTNGEPSTRLWVENGIAMCAGGPVEEANQGAARARGLFSAVFHTVSGPTEQFQEPLWNPGDHRTDAAITTAPVDAVWAVRTNARNLAFLGATSTRHIQDQPCLWVREFCQHAPPAVAPPDLSLVRVPVVGWIFQVSMNGACAVLPVAWVRFCHQKCVAVGKANRVYKGFKKLTRAQWEHPAVRAIICSNLNGWRLLEAPLNANAPLCVEEGLVHIDGAAVTAVGWTDGAELSVRDLWLCQNARTQEPWSATPPPLDGAWTVKNHDVYDEPCLFMETTVPVIG